MKWLIVTGRGASGSYMCVQLLPVGFKNSWVTSNSQHVERNVSRTLLGYFASNFGEGVLTVHVPAASLHNPT